MTTILQKELQALPAEWQEFAANLIREWVSNVMAALNVVRLCRFYHEIGQLLSRVEDQDDPAKLLAEIVKLQRLADKHARQLDLPADVKVRGEESFHETYKTYKDS